MISGNKDTVALNILYCSEAYFSTIQQQSLLGLCPYISSEPTKLHYLSERPKNKLIQMHDSRSIEGIVGIMK